MGLARALAKAGVWEMDWGSIGERGLVCFGVGDRGWDGWGLGRSPVVPQMGSEPATVWAVRALGMR